MKIVELFEAKRVATDRGYYTPGYDAESKNIRGTVQDWMARLNVTADDITKAIALAKELPSYADLKQYDKSTAGERKNGTFSFTKPQATEKGDDKYLVYANGQIRSSSRAPDWQGGEHRPTRLKTPKPRLVAGDPVKSLVKIYDGAFKELREKIMARKAKAEK